MIPCCRRTRHWPLKTLPAPVLPHDSLAGTLIVTIFHHRATPGTLDVNTNYSALLGIKSPELYDLLCTLNKILRKTLMIYIKAKIKQRAIKTFYPILSLPRFGALFTKIQITFSILEKVVKYSGAPLSARPSSLMTELRLSFLSSSLTFRHWSMADRAANEGARIFHNHGESPVLLGHSPGCKVPTDTSHLRHF